MKILLYILLFLVAGIVLFFVWGFMFYLKVTPIELNSNMDKTKKFQVIDEWFANLEKKRKFNGAVLISVDTTPFLMKGYGFMTHKKTDRINEYSSFQLASLSKQFTAAGIMLLKQRQKLEFDDKISKYIESFPYKDVTIRHLLNQTSGIPDVYMELAEKNKNDIKVLTNQRVIELLIQQKPTNDIKPNEEYNYSNINYVILAYLVEKISNKSHEEFMKTELFEPLGMKQSRIWNLISKDSTFTNKTDDLERFRKGFKKINPTYIDGVSGDGAVYTSVYDMLIWDKFWYENSLISKDIMKEAFLKPVLNNGSISDYGFGWVLENDEIWHNGSWLGANTYIWRNPKTKTCIAIFDNASSIFLENIIDELKRNIIHV